MRRRDRKAKHKGFAPSASAFSQTDGEPTIEKRQKTQTSFFGRLLESTPLPSFVRSLWTSLAGTQSISPSKTSRKLKAASTPYYRKDVSFSDQNTVATAGNEVKSIAADSSFDLNSFEDEPEADVITFEDQNNGDFVEFDLFDERDLSFLDPSTDVG